MAIYELKCNTAEENTAEMLCAIANELHTIKSILLLDLELKRKNR